MFDTLCTFPLPSELFAQVIHPTEPLLAIGLSSGHVSTLRIPHASGGEAADTNNSGRRRRGSDGTGFIDALWKTRRHKGSCRCLAFSTDGSNLFSGGTDGIVKCADTVTGRVTGKIAIPSAAGLSEGSSDAPTVIHALSPQSFLLATDSGALHIFDLRDPAPTAPTNGAKTAFVQSKPAQTHHPHIDYISSLTPLPPSQTSTSGFSKQFLTTGGTTLALTDIRRGVLTKSEDQEELLLSSVYVTGLVAKKSSGSTGEKSLVGASDGVITLWEKGQWDDQDERITISREKETLDCMAVFPDSVGGHGKHVAVGLGDGTIRFVRLGSNQVLAGIRHDEVDGVVGLGFDIEGRMISGGGQTVKVWQEHMSADEENDEETTVTKRATPDGDDADSDGSGVNESDQSSDAEVQAKKPRKKKKRGKNSAATSMFSFAGLD